MDEKQRGLIEAETSLSIALDALNRAMSGLAKAGWKDDRNKVSKMRRELDELLIYVIAKKDADFKRTPGIDYDHVMNTLSRVEYEPGVWIVMRPDLIGYYVNNKLAFKRDNGLYLTEKGSLAVEEWKATRKLGGAE